MCYLHEVNRPLGFLSPACRDQERSKQQLTSLPGEEPREEACLGDRAPGQSNGELCHSPEEHGVGEIALLTEAIPGGFREEAALTLGFEGCVGFRSIRGMAGRGHSLSKRQEM